jgi:hypothetical protein
LPLAAPASNHGLSPRPVQAQLSDLTVTVDCEGKPETTTVTNNSNTRSVTIKTVASIYKPRPGEEPYNFAGKFGTATARLDPGETVTFESGTGSNPNQNQLSGNEIYNNDVGSQEGAEIVTSTGERFTALCGTASGGSGQGSRIGGGAAGGSAAGHLVGSTLPYEAGTYYEAIYGDPELRSQICLVRTYAYGTATDAYGNKKKVLLIRTSMGRKTAERVNWKYEESVDFTRLYKMEYMAPSAKADIARENARHAADCAVDQGIFDFDFDC